MKELLDYQTTNVEELPEGIVAIKVSTAWCGPCKELSKTFHGLTNATLAQVDADLDNNFLIPFGVRSVPTTLIFQNQELKHKVVGNKPEEIQEKINSLI